MSQFHFLLLWLLMHSSPASSIEPKRFYQPGNVTLGVLLPLHVRTAHDKCGEFYAFSLGYTEAITFAIERINKDPELLPNVTLGFDIRDYCDTPVLAMKIANDFVKSNYLNELLEGQGDNFGSKLTINMDYLTAPISAVIGTEDSSSTTLVSSLLNVAAIPTISPFATSEELSSPYFNSFFRTIPPDGQQAKAMVDIIEYYQWTYIAAVAIDHSYGRCGLRALEREAYDRKTFCIAFSEYITRSGYKGKITSIVRKLKDAENIKVVILWSNYEPAKRFLKEATLQELEGRTFLISEAIAFINPDVLEKNAVILKGAIGIRPYLFTDNLFEDYLRVITLNKTRESANPWWKEFWTSHLNCSSMSEGACLNPVKIDDRAFAKLHNAFIPYLTDAVYALAHALDSLLKCKNANVTPEAMLLELRKVSFQGITGQVQFTKSGDPTYSSYDIVNFQKQAENYENVKVGTWTGGTHTNLTINEKRIKWANKENEPPISTCSHRCPPGTKQTITVSCCWECIKCPLGSISKQHSSPNCTKCPQLHKSNGDGTACLPLPVINIKWSDATAVVFLILTVIGLLATGMAIFVFIKNQSTPLVRVSNRELSLLLLVAIALCFVLTLLHLAQPTKTLCCTIYPLRYFINTTFVSILFLKTNRLVRAFQTNIIPNWFKRYIVDRKRQFLVVLGLNMVEVILAVLWLTLDPPYEHQEIRVQTHVFYTCMPFRSAIGSVLRATMFSYFILLSLVCAGYAFKARRLPENFNETRYIGSAMYVLLISWVSFYPVDTSLEGFYTTIVACATALVTAYGILLCVFAPKLFVILLRPEKNTNEFMKAEIKQFTNSATFSATIQQADVHPTNGI
ncbi:extracellular calcium-sensing receptor-like [Porites lutea]|uniref:extracellular calcium-sensing receptor-like n=1 Tax=Porites lutea TaxID=51062 RepID=UPI003CC6BEEF